MLLQVTNNYFGDVSVSYSVPPGGTFSLGQEVNLQGNRTAAINIPYVGTVFFEDIGTRPAGPVSPLSGVVISLNDLRWIFRYSAGNGVGPYGGRGALSIAVNVDGSLSLSSPIGTITALPAGA